MQIDNFNIKSYPSLSSMTEAQFSGKLSVCIATEEILGPVRNGGIASTYFHLAKGLVAQGHDVTVVLLKGPKVQQYDPDYWVNFYAEIGVELVYLDWVDEPFEHTSHPWQGRCYSFYNWLKKNRFDVVHTSEWRGGAYYALAAKKLGLAFSETLFIVKASSPFIWNRHYQMQPVEMHTLFSVAYLEQKCIEWADMVVGGSAHLLSFMQHIGYKIPQDRIFVQPNIVDFSSLNITDKRQRKLRSEVVKSKHLVFFGRLETRKGLINFCQAVDICVREGVDIEKITFLGKEGVLADQGGQTPLEFLQEKSQQWPFPVSYETSYGQPEALSFLCSEECIAFMPSLIENSTMTVYEALVFNIPFVATDVGGTAELIASKSHASSLINTGVFPLVEKIKEIVEKGQEIASPAFENDDNIRVWYQFHHYLAAVKEGTTGGKSFPFEKVAKVKRPDRQVACIVLVFDSGSPLEASGFNDFDHVIYCNFTGAPLSISNGQKVESREFYGIPVGEAINAVFQTITCEKVVLCNASDIAWEANAVDMLRHALSVEPKTIVSSCFRDSRGKLVLPLGGDVGHQIIDDRVYGAEVIACTRATWQELGGFLSYDFKFGLVHEFVTRALLKEMEYKIIPEVLFRLICTEYPLKIEQKSYKYLKAKAAIDASPLQLKKLLMFDACEAASKQLVAIDIYNDRK